MSLARRPELVALDDQLPDASALSIVLGLRRTSGCNKVPIVVMGLDEIGREEERFLWVGADAYLKKPLEVLAVDRIVLGMLGVAALR